MTAYVFSQSWNNIVTTSISEPNVVKMDLFTNKDGNHIVVQNSNGSNSIKYYLINSSGSLIRSATIETSSGAEFPCISGDNDKVYIVYKLGSNLKFRKSTNAGSSWESPISQAISSNTCNGVDIVYDSRGLHVVYAMQDNGNDYETYYRKVNSSGQWVEYKNVTDYGSEVGGFPSVAVSNNRVHVSYNTGNNSDPNNNSGIAKTRDKNGNNWETPQTVLDAQNETSAREKVQVRTNRLYDFYTEFYCDLGSCGFKFKVRSRPLDNSSGWSPYSYASYSCLPSQFWCAEQTANNNLHIIYGDYDLTHRYYNGSSWGSENYLSTITEGSINTPLSVVSNDLFVIWKDYGSNYLKYAQWDDAPLAPQNLSVTKSANNHPLLSWTKNNEPDMNNYQIWKKGGDEGGDWHLKATTTNTTYEDPDEIVLTGPKQANESLAYYKLKAVDLGSNPSDFSNEVNIRVGIEPPSKISAGNSLGESYSYQLYQNYPNPFNPTTQISYSIKAVGTVTLKVYDMLGKEVANLVNERKEPGNYSATFNAADLPSGIYVYKLTANDFTDTKKLMLVK